MGIQTHMEKSAASFTFHFKAFNNYSNILYCNNSTDHRTSGMVTKEYSRSREVHQDRAMAIYIKHFPSQKQTWRIFP